MFRDSQNFNIDEITSIKNISEIKNSIVSRAEYVESAENMEAVKRLGVDYAQGFYVGRPTGDLPKC